LRILVNALSARLGGGQTYLRHLLLNTPVAGYRVHLLCPDNLDLSDIPENVERIDIGEDLSNPYKRAVWENLQLGRLARRLNAQLLFCPGGLLPRIGLPEALRTAVTFQNMLPYDHDQRRRYPLGGRRVRDWLLEHALTSSMRRADLVIFISRFAANFIHTHVGGLTGRYVVIPHGIDNKFIANPDRPLPRPDAAPPGEYYLYVSFVDFYKSQIEVVQAFAALMRAGLTDGTLVLAGAGYPPYQLALRNEIARLGLGNAVVLSGNLPHDELPALYQNAQINIFASCTENCPNILMEMMASGRPALVSNCGPMPEFAGDAVQYFDPANVNSLIVAWRKLLTSVPEAEILARRAQAAVSNCTWQATSDATWRAIIEVGQKVDYGQ
jgi:glycosyltransferase involved in cell wall biosynthesis